MKKFIHYISAITGVIATVISIYYSTKWLVDSGTPFYLSIPIASIYIIFINLVFESAIGYFHSVKVIQKNMEKMRASGMVTIDVVKTAKTMMLNKRLTGVLVLFLWFIMMLYSMVSTIFGQYSQLTEIEKTYKNTEQASTKNKDAYYSKVIQLKETEVETLNIELNALLEQNNIDNVEQRAKYGNTTAKNQSRIDKLREDITQKQFDIQGLLLDQAENKDNVSNGFQVNTGTVYDYFFAVFGIPQLFTQFVMSLYPAVFVDIIAPVSFAIFLYRKKE